MPMSSRTRSVITRTAGVGVVGAALLLAGCSGTGGGGGDADASNYPEDTIEIIVPFSAGGPTDTVSRIIAEPMSEELGVQVVIQNVEGAGGTVGAGEASQADPDGYTALISHIGMSTAPALYTDLNYDPIEDFEPVGLITEVPMTIVSRPDLGPTNFAELVTYLQENQASVTLANAGVGSASNLCGLLIEDALGVDLQEVPYDGAAPALTDVVGGQVDLLCDQTTNTTGQILGGQVTAYAVTTPERVETLPDIPTTTEEGYEDLIVTSWHGLYLPAETPQEIVDALQSALATALADPTVAEQFAELGTAPVSADQATPDALATQLAEQTEVWAGILTAPAN